MPGATCVKAITDFLEKSLQQRPCLLKVKLVSVIKITAFSRA